MGAEESRLTSMSDVAGGHGSVSRCRSSSTQSYFSLHEDTKPWTLLHQCTLQEWKGGHADAAGFKEKVLACEGALHKDCSHAFCINRQGIININKSSHIFSFRKRSKFTKMAEHFEYNHIPAQLSSIQNFHVRSVLCFQGRIVVLHLVRNMGTQFGVIDLKTNKFLGVFGKHTVEFVNESLRGSISPDGTKCLVKTPLPPSSVRGPASYVLRLYNLKGNGFPMIYEVQLQCRDSHFSFDPRFHWNRIAVTNFEQGTDNSLSLVHLASNNPWEIIATNHKADDTRPSLYPNLRELLYTPDGSLIVTMMTETICNCQELKRTRFRNCQPIMCSIFVFDANTTDPLHCVQYHRYTCSQHMCPSNFMPVFSGCASRMAMAMNIPDQHAITYVQVYNLPKPLNLQSLCRTVILQCFAEDEVLQLPLPQRLIQFLQFYPEY
ncbi:uncharacterized protein LOC106168346 [Lingula anatina]|uniref:Uncharacterized protein LOC106168346 n=1 Tax=Lingula anatina TaxID=7574 RepID=A0A1S3IZ54_LINAN|nr:uncharacterized protein LOC106168346 [Lingula anatina]XP_013402830.1 uncharacterized protein LOC106168346 [Lingula anatina]|eukprot:XP_013402829.1 uncharacterized protein LOC106168346 [Lingula anatina]